jgi:hypothetical protein
LITDWYSEIYTQLSKIKQSLGITIVNTDPTDWYADVLTSLTEISGVLKTSITAGQIIGFFVDANNGNDLNDGLTDLTPFATVAKLLTTLQTYKLEGGVIIIYLIPNPTGNVYTGINLQNISTFWSGLIELNSYDYGAGLNTINLGSGYELLRVRNSPDLEVIVKGITVVSTSTFSNPTVSISNVRRATVTQCFFASGVTVQNCFSVAIQTNTFCLSITSTVLVLSSSNVTLTNNILANRGYISITNVISVSISNVTRQSTVNTQADYLFFIRGSSTVLISGILALQGDRAVRWFSIDNSQVVINLTSITYTTPSGAVSGSATIPFIDIRNSDVKFNLTNSPVHTTTGTFIRATIDTISKTIFVVNNVLDYSFNFVAGATGGGTFTVPNAADFNGLGYRNVGSGLLATNYQGAIDELLTLTASINIQTVNADLQLQNNSARVQDLTNPTSTQRQILLPSLPALGKEFVFLNSSASLGSLGINAYLVAPGNRYAIIWNGSLWRSLN